MNSGLEEGLRGAIRNGGSTSGDFGAPSIPQDPRPGEIRVLILGSSESFGLYESPGLEFPAQLASRLRDRGDFEVVNAAVAGMTLATMTCTGRTGDPDSSRASFSFMRRRCFTSANGSPKSGGALSPSSPTVGQHLRLATSID